MGIDGLTGAVFLDRDGVLNDVDVRDGIPYSPRTFADFHIREEAPAQLRRLKEAGRLLVVVTNQPDIARGKMPQADLDKMTALLREVLPVDDVLVCPHDDADGCQCRKPRPGLLLQAAERYAIDLSHSYFIGDTWKDAEAARNAGCISAIIDATYNSDVRGDFRAASLCECVDIILNSQVPPSGSDGAIA